MLSQLSLREAVEQIKLLIDEEKLQEAYRACLEILRYDPENIHVIHLKNKIERRVRKINRQAVKADLAKLKPLWREKKYEELFMNLKKLESFLPDYPHLKTILLKAKKCYDKQFRHQQEHFYDDETKRIYRMINEKQFQDAILANEKLQTLKIHGETLKKLLIYTRKKWIDHELEQNKILLHGEKYEDILLFLQKLLKLDPNDARLHHIIENKKSQYQRYRIDEKREFIYASLEKIRTLYLRKKYEKTVEAVEEILNVDSKNREANFFWKRALKRTKRLIQKECCALMIEAWKAEGEDYKKNKKEFIRI